MFTHLFIPLFKILSDENFLKQLVANSLLPNCKEGYKEEGFYSKYLHWGSVNKWG